MYGDDVIIGKDPACGQLIRAYEEFGMGVLGVKQVSEEAITKYSSLKVEKIRDNLFKCTDMIEKPSKDKIMSLYSILGRCVLTPDIFDILDNTAPGAGGEIQLTDAMCAMARTQGMIAVDYTGKRYDMGNKLGIIQAAVEVALEHPEIGKDFREYLKEYVAGMHHLVTKLIQGFQKTFGHGRPAVKGAHCNLFYALLLYRFRRRPAAEHKPAEIW